MSIALESLPVTEVVVEIPGGHRQVTPQRGGRYYLRAGSEERYRSISGLPWPSDFAGATRYMAGSYVADHIAELAATPLDEIRAKVAKGAEDELTKAADRGTAVHHYVECRVTGRTPDWDYLGASGACPYLPAVDAYLADHAPGIGLDEVTVFGESCGHRIAGTVDRVDLGDVIVVKDYKTRTTRHDRREKEAAQLGAYAWCLTNGVYVDEHGKDRTLDRIDHCEVVTFCPDGSYGIHRVETAVAVAAHEARMAFVGMGVGDLYAKAERGMAASINDSFQRRLDALTDDERSRLMPLWREHGMPRIADLDAEHYLTAARLFAQVEPWHIPDVRVAPLATDHQRDDIRRRLEALPADIAKDVQSAASGLRSFSSAFLSTDDIEDWERVVVPAEAHHARRIDEARAIPGFRSIAATMRRSFDTWTAIELEQAYALAEAAAAGVLSDIVDHPGVEPRYGVPTHTLEFDDHPKRDVVAVAKREAALLGLTVPKKFDDVLGDVVLFAATWAALQRKTPHNTNHTQESNA